MIKCANCANKATYTYAINQHHGIDYCALHVPKFLQAQKRAGMLPLRTPAPVVVEEVVEEVVAPKKSSKKTITE